MRPPPLYVLAATYAIARSFVTQDLKDDGCRLKFINHPDDLRGRRDLTIIIHPTADRHRDYDELMHMIRYQGLYVMRFDDSYNRARYHQEQEERRCKVHPTMVTAPTRTNPSTGDSSLWTLQPLPDSITTPTPTPSGSAKAIRSS